MATIVTDAHKATSPAPGKPGRKRNPFNFEASNQKFREPSIFADFVRQYPDQSGTFLKVYRLLPEIDLSLIGASETAIHTTHDAAEATESYLADRWGQGRYWVLFNDENRPRGQQQIAQTWIDVNDPAAKPAVYDIATLKLASKANVDEIQRLVSAGKLERDERGNLRVVRAGDRAAAALPPPAAPAPVVLAPLNGTSISDQIALKLLERAIPSATPLSPKDTLDEAFKIAERLNPHPSGESAIVAELRTELAAIRSKLDGGSNLDKDFATYERMESFFSKIGAGRATAAVGSDEPIWMRPLISVGERLATVLAVRFAAPPVAAAAAPGAPRPQQVVAPPPNAPAPPAASYPQLLPADAPIMNRALQAVNLGLDAFNRNVIGYDYAAWLVGFYPGGREVFHTLVSAGGPDEIIGLIAMFPQIQELTAPILADPARKDQLAAWLGDFLDYDPDASSSEGEPEPGTEAAA